MSGWDIHPAGVNSVLDRTSGKVVEFGARMKELDSTLQGRTSRAPRSCRWLCTSWRSRSLRRSRSWSPAQGACMNAAARATNYYVEGDLEMVADAQRVVAAVPRPKPLLRSAYVMAQR